MEKNCQNSSKKNAIFVCELCDFKCSKNSDWIRHVDTKKHTHRLKGNVQETKETKNYAEFVCNCGKAYISNSGLWQFHRNFHSEFFLKKKDLHNFNWSLKNVILFSCRNARVV